MEKSLKGPNGCEYLGFEQNYDVEYKNIEFEDIDFQDFEFNNFDQKEV